MDNTFVDDAIETKIDRAKKCALIWSKSRAEAGKSQEYMALGLGVSKKTIQNWEKGISAPNFIQSAEWFHLLRKNPMPYYLDFLYCRNPELLTEEQQNQRLDESLYMLISNLPIDEKRQLIYLLSCVHGSSSVSVLQLMTAHLQSPLRDRVSHTNIIIQDYELAKDLGELSNPELIQPDMQLLKHALAEGKESVLSGKQEYSVGHVDFRE